MFSLSDLDLDNAPVIAPVQEGTYRVRIVELAIYDQKEPKTGRYMTCALDVADVPTAETVRHFITMLPDRNTDEKQAVRAKSRIKQFFDKFNLPYGLEPVEGDGKASFPEAVGAEAVVLLGLKPAQNGGEENNIKSLNPPTPAS